MPGRGAIVLAFATHACITTSVGARMPAIRDQTGLDAPQLGLALGAYAVALLVGTRLGGSLVDRLGSRRVLRVGIPSLCLALIPVGLAMDLVTLAAALVLLGLLSGGLDVAMNAYAVELESRLGRPILSGVHAAWSAGMLITAGFAALAVALGQPPLAHFVTLALALVALSTIGLARLDDLRPTVKGEGPAAPVDRRMLLAPILSIGAIGFASFVAEGALIDWGTIYLQDVGRITPTVAVMAYLANALGMLTSRLLGDRLVTITGPIALVRWAGLAMVIALACVIARTEPLVGLVAYALLGFAIGPVFPTALSAAGNRTVGQTMVVGWVVSLAYLGSIVGPLAIGLAAGSVGLRWAFLVPLALAGAMALLAPAVRGATRGPRAGTITSVEIPPL